MFDYFISLGWFCGTASSLAKYGFRSSSDPFDWYISDLKGVLHFIETDFSDFLFRDNLEEEAEGARMLFKDIKYNCIFNHDIKISLDDEYAGVYKKYMRRIERFRAKIHNPSCFVRAVRDENELRYIEDNQNYIQQTIKKSNSLNEIVFLIPQWLEIHRELSLRYFVLNLEEYKDIGRETLRGMLDNNEDVIDFLQSNITVRNVVSNLKWDIEAEHSKEIKECEVIRHRYDIAIKLLKDDLNLSLIPKNIAIYGAGNIGKAFFNKCHEICHVECFIDADSNENEYKGTPILHRDKINTILSNTIIVTPSYDMVNIKNWFLKYHPKANLIVIDTLFEK